MMVSRLARFARSEHLILFLALGWTVVAAVSVPGFASWWNFQTVLGYMLPLVVVAVGLTFVLITGGIDLSITSIMALSSVGGAFIMSGESGLLGESWLGIPLGLFVMLAIGAAAGAVNGTLVTRCAIPPFIATLTLMMFGSGVAVWMTRSEKIGGLPPVFLHWGQHPLFALALVVVVVGVAHLFLQRTLYGRWLTFIGLNPATADLAGVPRTRLVFAVYVVSGLLSAVGAILLTARLETGDPVMAQNNLLDIVGATILGGTSLQGGRGKVLWTVYGVLFLALLDNTLNLLSVHYYFITLCKGGVILLAALLDAMRRRAAQ